MDLTAATICMENNMEIQVFGLAEENSMVRAVCGEKNPSGRHCLIK